MTDGRIPGSTSPSQAGGSQLTRRIWGPETCIVLMAGAVGRWSVRTEKVSDSGLSPRTFHVCTVTSSDAPRYSQSASPKLVWRSGIVSEFAHPL
eukprot:1294747-Rhodomonas_salina.1